MERLFNSILALKERGLLPDAVMRALVRLMCAQWVKTFECGGDLEKQAFYKKKYFEKLRSSAGALHQDDANIQHYEVPTDFFHLMLGPYLKYSCCLFPDASTSLADAEVAMLRTFIEERLKLSEVVAAAGGVAQGGADVVVLVGTRDGQSFRREIDLPLLFREGDLTDDAVLQGGDVIYVDRAATFYIYGEVQRPGAFRLERDMTVMQALATGGGTTSRGTVKGLQIHRRDEIGRVSVIEPRMNDPLRPDDVIFVQESLF